MKRALEGQTIHFICLSPSLVPFGSSLSLFFKDSLVTIALVKLYSDSCLMETRNNKSTVPLHSKVIKGLLISCRKLAETQSCNLVMYQILCLLFTFSLQLDLETLFHSEKS